MIIGYFTIMGIEVSGGGSYNKSASVILRQVHPISEPLGHRLLMPEFVITVPNAQVDEYYRAFKEKIVYAMTLAEVR
jgi:hypothetical protein